MTLLEITGNLNVLFYGISAIMPALGVSWIFVSVINGIVRQPEARGALMSAAYIGFAVVEALAILAFVLAFVLN